jgi:energy-coupling factor transporter ATP-binding protein EcfA2
MLVLVSPAHAASLADDLAAVDPDVTLAEQIQAAARAAGRTEPDVVVDFALDELEADALLDRVPRPMSRGERQICALLITLAAPRPELTLIDPTAGLDARRRRVVVDVLRDLAFDRRVTVVSDDPMFG